MDILKKIAIEQMRMDIPEFHAGDTIKVYTKIREGEEKERIQVFEGVVIRRRGEGISETFTVRKVSYGVGVEKTFPVHSPMIDKVELVKKGRRKRARIYYIRELKGKAARQKIRTK